jgi:DNA polymerase III subunit chi
MGAAYFYHLTQRSLAETLRMLLAKSLDNGWKVAVRGTHQDGLAALDEALWLGPKEGFLPHGIAGGPHDALQPVLLTTATEAGAQINCVMAVHGAAVDAAEVKAKDRVCILFDGTDPEEVSQARQQWKALTQAGASAQYWSEESGRWEKKAEA